MKVREKSQRKLAKISAYAKLAYRINFLLERDVAHLLTTLYEIEKNCVKCQRIHRDKNEFAIILIVVIKCMHIQGVPEVAHHFNLRFHI